jgi:hypothetical protein
MGERSDIFGMNQVPMTFSVAAGGILAAFFVIVTLYGIRFCQRGKPLLGFCMIFFAAFYGIGIIIASV